MMQLSGLALVVVAAALQGTFLVPMTRMQKWAWEHAWAVFSLLAMLVFNWALSLALLPNPVAVYRAVPSGELVTLALFGAGWGGGAVLFGLGMDKLGLALGYPLIMGLNATVGAVVPLVLSGGDLLSAKSVSVLGGTALAIAGIVMCSIAGSRKQASSESSTLGGSRGFAGGLAIAVAAGFLCSLPNIGMIFGQKAIAAAKDLGASEALAGNAVWAVFFTFGGLVNVAYCLVLAARRGTISFFTAPGSLRDLGLGAIMSAMWIGSFYLYGAGAARLGAWGPIAGWPVFIFLSIAVGVLCGLNNGEWRGAPSSALRLLASALALILIAVGALALSSRV